MKSIEDLLDEIIDEDLDYDYNHYIMSVLLEYGMSINNIEEYYKERNNYVTIMKGTLKDISDRYVKCIEEDFDCYAFLNRGLVDSLIKNGYKEIKHKGDTYVIY